jgi:hypothetical protein
MTQDTHLNADGDTTSEAVPDGPSPRYVRGLLVVVIGLGLVLLGGAAIVVGTIIKRMNNPDAIPTKPGFGEVEISVPADGELMSVQNGDNRIILHLRDDQGNLLILLDPRKGEEKGRIRLQKD